MKEELKFPNEVKYVIYSNLDFEKKLQEQKIRLQYI